MNAVSRRVLFAGAASLGVPRLARAQALPKERVWGASATVEAYHGFLFLGIPLGFYSRKSRQFFSSFPFNLALLCQPCAFLGDDLALLRNIDRAAR